jgi:hypothetical protein
MENLLQRLKPELRLKITDDITVYPRMIAALITELEEKYYINDVKYMHILDLENYYRNTYDQFWVTPWDCLINQN